MCRKHYDRASSQLIYVIPFEQIQVGLSCVYYHVDKKYYRSSIIQVDQIDNSDILILEIYLVDYGIIVSNVNYQLNSTNLKFLHKDFSLLPTEIYQCRLADIYYPPTCIQWSDDACRFIIDHIEERHFRVQIIGSINSVYCIYIWIESNSPISINQLLIHNDFAVDYDDRQYSKVKEVL